MYEYDFTALVAARLGINVAVDPLDGGTHKSFAIQGDDFFEGLLNVFKFLKERKPVKILSVCCYEVLRAVDAKEVVQWKVRCV